VPQREPLDFVVIVKDDSDPTQVIQQIFTLRVKPAPLRVVREAPLMRVAEDPIPLSQIASGGSWRELTDANVSEQHRARVGAAGREAPNGTRRLNGSRPTQLKQHGSFFYRRYARRQHGYGSERNEEALYGQDHALGLFFGKGVA
jgi:hypothetical protein